MSGPARNEDAIAAALVRLAESQERLATAIRDNTEVMDVFLEMAPSRAIARVLGVSDRTVRRHRKTRAMQRLAGGVGG
jgi:FixJ family two-component response regulator